jgi:Protein of unknown function (DUF2914)
MRILMSILISVLLVPSLAAAQEASSEAAGLKVEKAVAATGVEEHEPAGEATEFDASAGKVYCWSKILADTPPATIKHVWYVDDQQVFEITLDIKYPSTRTWSVKTIWAGTWRVEITDEAGKVLSVVGFTVK